MLTGDSDEQENYFYHRVPSDSILRLFGAVKPLAEYPGSPEQVIGPGGTEYRRWVNFPWKMIEGVGQPEAGDWTPQEDQRLKSFVQYAHSKNLWIRFYTLDGFKPADSQGWSESYNFGSLDAVKIRWKAAIEAGVDFVAVDQYEEFAKFLHTVTGK